MSSEAMTQTPLCLTPRTPCTLLALRTCQGENEGTSSSFPTVQEHWQTLLKSCHLMGSGTRVAICGMRNQHPRTSVTGGQ